MVKLVGVLGGGGDEGGEASPRICSARRQLPLNIEQDLTMIMAVDDYCMACEVDPCGRGNRHLHNHDWCNFLRNYRSLNKDEVLASLKVTPEEVLTILTQQVTCVGCRRSVEELFLALTLSGDSALEPLIIDGDGVVSINKEHGEVEDILANLFCCQVRRLTKELLENGELKGRTGRRGERGGRCAQHSLGIKKLVNMNKMLTTDNWLDIWDCMVKECKEEVVLLPCTLLRETVDGYLKKHRFCTDCTYMVNRAYTLLLKEGKEPLVAIGGKCPASDPLLNRDGTPNLFSGISVCTTELHVHVKCDTGFISQLFLLLEPELNSLKQERHAKSIEKAQNEVLICIGLALFQRLQKIQQKLMEGEKTRDLLFLTVIKTLRMNMDMAADKKRGVGDLELLCQEIEGGDKGKEGKRERKRKQRARRKESKSVTPMVVEEGEVDDEQSNDKENNNSRGESCEKECQDCVEVNTVSDMDFQKKAGGLSKSVCGLAKQKMKYQPSLEDMLDENNGDGAVIPKEDIRMFLAKKEDMEIRRQQLREDLRKKFAQLCVKGVTPCSGRK